MESDNINIIEILIAEISRLVEEKEFERGYNLLLNALEEIEKIVKENAPPSAIFDTSMKIISLLQYFPDKNVKELLKKVKGFIKGSLDLKNLDHENLYARFLAVYSQVAIKLNINPLDELNEAEEIFYKLATEKGLVKQYAAFINLFYAPIMKELGYIKKALKSLEVAVDELYHYYKQSHDKSFLAFIGELYAHEALILYEVKDLDNSLDLFEQALNFFTLFENDYIDYKVSICLNLLNLYKRKGKRGRYYDFCEKLIEEKNR